ncbi:hypothetical protein [Pontibacter sp. H249]|uniref:hypothetical protein n=1 Tax=Pontibacter sp. H249 TaxID=3133420 RepID=UPI0030BDCF0F
MRFVLLYIVILFYAIPVISQEPQFKWGEKLNRKFGQLDKLDIIGVDEDGFYATYTVNEQITLEHYDPQHKRFWTTALLPHTPDGHKADFHSVQMIKSRLYLFSSSTGDGETQVYAQEISHNGNYHSQIKVVAQGVAGEKTIIETSEDDAAVAVLITGSNKSTVTLLTGSFSTNWSQHLTISGNAEELLVQPDGTVYLLAKAPAAAPATTAYYLYQFNKKNGTQSLLVLGHMDYRPLSAKLTATPDGNVVVAGYMSPSSSVASHHPEPVGTFIYRIEKHNMQNPFSAYTSFSRQFISDYKRFKPDNDNSQRLRNLHLDKVIPLSSGGLYLLGEVCVNEDRAGTMVYHNNDIILIKLRQNGTPVFATSINKLQNGTNKQNTIRSYFAAIVQDTLRVLYLNFEYNKLQDNIAMFSHKYTLKTPVLVSILPDGKQNIKRLNQTQTGRDHGFYLRPCSAYELSNTEYIVIGMGPEFYRYGRMTF